MSVTYIMITIGVIIGNEEDTYNRSSAYEVRKMGQSQNSNQQAYNNPLEIVF